MNKKSFTPKTPSRRSAVVGTPRKSLQVLVLLGVLGVLVVKAEDGKSSAILWASDFEKVAAGAEPPDVLILEGAFTVQQDGPANRVLELPGVPLETMGMVFGPARRQDVAVWARIRSEKKGRLYPHFGVGLLGPQGYRLMVNPTRDAVELVRDGDVLTRAPFKWESGQWTWLSLAVALREKKLEITGKAWLEGRGEPAEPMIRHAAEPSDQAGGATIWAMPYSGKPIQFDDVRYEEK